MEEMSFKDFEEKYMQSNKRWDFAKFSIVCRKCGSSKVEYNNTIEQGISYYNDPCEMQGEMVVKCHSCGNAFTLQAEEEL